MSGGVTRRELLGVASGVSVVALAGCSRLPFAGGSMTWEEAYNDTMSEEDKSTLEPTPVAAEEVESQEEAKTAVDILGWTVGVEVVSEPLLDDLEASAETATDLQPTMDDGIRLLDEGLALVQEMKDTSALGTSAWDVATSSAPSLEQYAELARVLRDQLQTQRDRVVKILNGGSSLLVHIDSLRADGTTDYGELPNDIESTRSAYEGFIGSIESLDGVGIGR